MLSHFASRGPILLFHMCFGIRISSPFHLATQMIPIQNLNCPKNAKNDARTWFYKRVFCKYGGSSMKMESSSMNMECSSMNVESISNPMSAIFIKCLLWKNNVLGSEVIKCMNILGSIDFSFPISEPWLLSSPRRREISSCLSMSSGREAWTFCQAWSRTFKLSSQGQGHLLQRQFGPFSTSRWRKAQCWIAIQPTALVIPTLGEPPQLVYY